MRSAAARARLTAALSALTLAVLGVFLLGAGADTGRPQTIVRPREMVDVPAGSFEMGSTLPDVIDAARLCSVEYTRVSARPTCNRAAFEVELPRRRVLLRAFAVDRVEVTNAEYRACARAGRCDPAALANADPRLTAPEAPVAGVTWDEAVAFCRFRGKRLPTEAEWEKAARGSDGRTWPWGSQWQPAWLNHGRISPEIASRFIDPDLHRDADGSDGARLSAAVGSYPAGRSPYGALDLAGNVAEWTADVFLTEPPQAHSVVQPRGPADGPLRTVRGGSFLDPAYRTRAAVRSGAEPRLRANERGFRCAQDR
jgi:formylglycine-generating enzyme